jgi:predicted Zn-dependent peptidase
VFEEIAFVRGTSFSAGQVTRIRDALLRDFERNSQDNGYLLNQIARRYEDGDAADVTGVVNLPERIKALTGDAVQRAARTYLDPANYVKVTLMPETK